MREKFYWVQISPETLSDEELLNNYVQTAIPHRLSEAKELLEKAISHDSRKRAIQLIVDTVSGSDNCNYRKQIGPF